MPTPPTRTAKLKQLDKNQVHAMALENLKRHLELKGSGEQSAPDKVLDVLLAAATNNTSIEQECSAMVGAPSSNTVRGVLRESLELEKLERQVNQALGSHLNRRYWRGLQTVAVDLVEVPYHGLAAQNSDEIRRGKAKQGTTHFHVFATAYVVRQHRRVTLALHYVRLNESLVSVLDALKSWLDELGVHVVRRKSRPSRTGTKQLPPTTLVYAVVGKRLRRQLRKRSFPSVVETYRRRFGIESSYRQINQARLRTSSRSPELRLLAVAIALLLRNLWALCRWMTLARSGPGRPTGKGNFRFQTLLRWISRMVETRLALQTSVDLPTPSPISF